MNELRLSHESVGPYFTFDECKIMKEALTKISEAKDMKFIDRQMANGYGKAEKDAFRAGYLLASRECENIAKQALSQLCNADRTH